LTALVDTAAFGGIAVPIQANAVSHPAALEVKKDRFLSVTEVVGIDPQRIV
jgi:hypothetical protein